MSISRKTSKICINKSVVFFAIGGLVTLGFILFSTLIRKTNTANTTRAASVQCIYETPEDCKADGCTGQCKKCKSGGLLFECQKNATIPIITITQVAGAKFIDSRYLSTVARPVSGKCQPKNQEVIRTSDGQCWSLRSVEEKLENSYGNETFLENVCIHEKTDGSKCSTDSYCKGYTEYLPLVEAYDKDGNGIYCNAAGIRTSISNLGNEYGVGCGLERVSDEMCSSTYSCNSRATFKIIENSCYHLSWRKCTSVDFGTHEGNLPSGRINTCCSDKVEMSFCKK